MVCDYDDMTEYDELRLLHTNCSNDCEVQGDESSLRDLGTEGWKMGRNRRARQEPATSSNHVR
jgi:hypothetical protein